jgi:large subunit ribosomal protein L17
MRHLVAGRKLGRNASHRKAMFRNMAVSLIKTVRILEGEPGQPKVAGRIVTTVPKAKELRPMIEKLITLARKARKITQDAAQFQTDAERGSDAWKAWRDSDKGKSWVNATAPALTMRRRAFADLRDDSAVEILFEDLAARFQDRTGGYTRVVRLARVRLGDAGEQALIEFVGTNDRVKAKKRKAPVVEAAAN